MQKIYLFLCAAAAAIALNISDADAIVRDKPSDKNFILSFNSSIKEAKKSVVNISAKAPSKASEGFADEFFNDPFFRHFFGAPAPRAGVDKRFGSGVIISPDGYIITNNHLVESATDIKVLFNDEQLDAKLIGTDEKTDVALIKIEAKNLPAIKFADSDALQEGDVVFAIGNPFGVGESVSSGIISALNKNNIGLNAYEDFIQTDAAINPGNSGGALVDSRGALIGINSAIITRSGGANGIGFAIPANMAKDIALKLATGKQIERGYLGVYMADLTGDLKKTYEAQRGAIITEVLPNSAAAAAGLKRGDLVLKADEMVIKTTSDLRNYVGKKQPGESVALLIEREKRQIKIKAKLASQEGAATSSNALGLELRDIMPADKLPQDAGAVVKAVKEKSPAARAGIRPGDLIVGLNSEEITSASDFAKALGASKGKYIKIWLQRGGMTNVLVINKEEK